MRRGTLSNLVLQFKQRLELVLCSPGLSEADAVLGVLRNTLRLGCLSKQYADGTSTDNVLSLEITGDQGGFRVADTGSFEDDLLVFGECTLQTSGLKAPFQVGISYIVWGTCFYF